MPNELDFRPENYPWLSAAPRSPRSHPLQIRVLVVDDHPLFAEALTLTLDADPRFQVVARAADGREALRLTADLDPDIVLMDLEMPVMDGVEATRRLRAIAPAAKVVVVSAAREPGAVARAFEAGAVAYVPKDTPAGELVTAVLAVARAGRPFAERMLLDDPEVREVVLKRSA